MVDWQPMCGPGRRPTMESLQRQRCDYRILEDSSHGVGLAEFKIWARIYMCTEAPANFSTYALYVEGFKSKGLVLYTMSCLNLVQTNIDISRISYHSMRLIHQLQVIWGIEYCVHHVVNPSDVLYTGCRLKLERTDALEHKGCHLCWVLFEILFEKSIPVGSSFDSWSTHATLRMCICYWAGSPHECGCNHYRHLT